jgi:hypothetical protein
MIIFVCDRVSVRYGKNVTDVDISECVTESVSVNSMDKSDGGNAALLIILALVYIFICATSEVYLTPYSVPPHITIINSRLVLRTYKEYPS